MGAGARRDSALRARLPLLVEPEGEQAPGPPDDRRTPPDERWWERRDRAGTTDPAAAQAPDDRLRLIFTCCHPALAAEALITGCLRAARPGRYVLQAAIASVYAAAGPEAALAEVGRLERDGSLGGYQYLPAVKADLLARLGRDDEAAAACRRALELTVNWAERAFLAGRLAALGSSGARAE